MPGQPQLSTNEFFGVDALNLTVLDPGGPSNLIIKRSDAFKLQVSLLFGGHLAPLILCCLCWKICYCLDVLCADHGEPGDAGQQKPGGRTFCQDPVYCAYNYPTPEPRDFPPHTGVIVYDNGATEVTVPANSLEAATYRVTAFARFYCREAPHRAPYIAAFADGTVIEIVD